MLIEQLTIKKKLTLLLNLLREIVFGTRFYMKITLISFNNNKLNREINLEFRQGISDFNFNGGFFII